MIDYCRTHATICAAGGGGLLKPFPKKIQPADLLAVFRHEPHALLFRRVLLAATLLTALFVASAIAM
jgi:hypothetical protein